MDNNSSERTPEASLARRRSMADPLSGGDRLTSRPQTPAAAISLAILGVFFGAATWWVLLYGAAGLVSMVTQVVWWSQLGIAIANVGAIVTAVVIAVHQRSARPFMIGAVLGLIGFWVLLLGLRLI